MRKMTDWNIQKICLFRWNSFILGGKCQKVYAFVVRGAGTGRWGQLEKSYQETVWQRGFSGGIYKRGKKIFEFLILYAGYRREISEEKDQWG